MTAVWFEKIKTSVGWNRDDDASLSTLRRCLDSDISEAVEALAKHLVQFKGTQTLMGNSRFVQRLHEVLREWLEGFLGGTFDEPYIQNRSAFVLELVEVGLTFDDVILLEMRARRWLFGAALEALGSGQDPDAFAAAMQALDKALCIDAALIYNGYIQVRDAEIERSLLERFLAITGFSRTLYENLAEAQEWTEVTLQHTRLF